MSVLSTITDFPPTIDVWENWEEGHVPEPSFQHEPEEVAWPRPNSEDESFTENGTDYVPTSGEKPPPTKCRKVNNEIDEKEPENDTFNVETTDVLWFITQTNPSYEPGIARWNNPQSDQFQGMPVPPNQPQVLFRSLQGNNSSLLQPSTHNPPTLKPSWKAVIEIDNKPNWVAVCLDVPSLVSLLDPKTPTLALLCKKSFKGLLNYHDQWYHCIRKWGVKNNVELTKNCPAGKGNCIPLRVEKYILIPLPNRQDTEFLLVDFQKPENSLFMEWFQVETAKNTFRSCTSSNPKQIAEKLLNVLIPFELHQKLYAFSSHKHGSVVRERATTNIITTRDIPLPAKHLWLCSVLACIAHIPGVVDSILPLKTSLRDSPLVHHFVTLIKNQIVSYPDTNTSCISNDFLLSLEEFQVRMSHPTSPFDFFSMLNDKGKMEGSNQ